MRVGVLGAGGTIAPAVVRDLAESEEIEELLLLDLDEGRAAAVAESHGGGKARAAAVDARAGLSDAIAGCDALVNSASYRINLDAMRACLAAGCHYLDLGGLYHMTARQLGLHDEFREAGLVAVLGIGSSPGKTNLLALHGSRMLPAVESAYVSAAGRDLDPPRGLSIPYALQTLIDELTMPPVAIRDGHAVELEPLEPGGEVDFGEPIGRAETIHTLHSEMLTFPESFNCREGTFRLSLAQPLVERLRALASASEEEIEATARDAVRPSAHTVSAHVVECVSPPDRDGARAAVRLRSLTVPMESWGLGGGIVSTAAPMAAAVRLLGRGRIAARGALPPERCIEPEDMFAEVESRGCSITIESGEAVAA